MPNATARYVITADDNTKAAIASVRRGFTSLDRSAKMLGKTIIGLGTGAAFYGLARAIKGLFGNVAQSNTEFANSLEAVKKSFKDLATPKSGVAETAKAMNDLARTLTDPKVKEGADSLFSMLILGAAKLAKLTALTVGNLVTIGKGIGLIKGGRQDEIDRLIVDIAKRREGKSALARGFEKTFSGVGGEDEAAVLESLERRLYDLQYAEGVSKGRQGRIASGVRGGRDRGAGFDIKPVTEAPLGKLNLSLNARAAELVDGMKLDDFGDAIIESTEGIADRMSEALKEPFTELTPYAEQAARNMQDTFADFLFDPFQDGIKGMLKGFIDVIRRMVAEAAAAKIFGSKKSGGFGLGDFITGVVGGLFGGGKAAGGPVSAGTSYLVGERGPELFTPRGGGHITPNHALGGGVVQNITVDARGATVDAIRAIPAAMAEAKRQAVAEVQELVRRGRL